MIIIMNNDKSSLESPNIPTFHYANQIPIKSIVKMEINKQKKK